jgi:hypothetical protein
MKWREWQSAADAIPGEKEPPLVEREPSLSVYNVKVE